MASSSERKQKLDKLQQHCYFRSFTSQMRKKTARNAITNLSFARGLYAVRLMGQNVEDAKKKNDKYTVACRSLQLQRISAISKSYH